MTPSQRHTHMAPASLLGTLLANTAVLQPPVLRRLLAFNPPPCEVLPMNGVQQQLELEVAE